VTVHCVPRPRRPLLAARSLALVRSHRRHGGAVSTRRWLALVVAPLTIAAAVTGAGYAAAELTEEPPAPAAALGPGDVTVRIDAHYTKFEPDHLRVVIGTRVRFLLDNHDPINHELITGGPTVHARHARGTEAEHPSIPGEVSVGPNGSAMTTYTFDRLGTYEFACHLPGHYDYGMRGEIEVVPPTPDAEE